VASIQIYFEWGEIFSLTGRRDEASAQRPKPEGLRAGVGFLVRGQQAPSPSARGSGERCKLPQRGLGQSPGKFEIWCKETSKLTTEMPYNV